MSQIWNLKHLIFLPKLQSLMWDLPALISLSIQLEAKLRKLFFNIATTKQILIISPSQILFHEGQTFPSYTCSSHLNDFVKLSESNFQGKVSFRCPTFISFQLAILNFRNQKGEAGIWASLVLTISSRDIRVGCRIALLLVLLYTWGLIQRNRNEILQLRCLF